MTNTMPGLPRSPESELQRMSAEQMVHANGVDLCAQTFGDPDDPPFC